MKTSKRQSAVPSYRQHKQSGQAIVTSTNSSGRRKDVLLGMYGSQESRVEYARVIAEWESSGRELPRASVADLTVGELITRFWPWVRRTTVVLMELQRGRWKISSIPCAPSITCTAVSLPKTWARSN